MSRENVEMVRRSLDAWNRGDVDGWLDGSHPEIEWHSEVARRVEGSETVYVGCDDRALGALGRVPARGEASGIPVDGPVAFVFEFEGGLARKVRSYLDPEEGLEAVGLE